MTESKSVQGFLTLLVKQILTLIFLNYFLALIQKL